MHQMLDKPRIAQWMDQGEIDFRQNATRHLHTAQEIGILPAQITEFGIATFAFEMHHH